MLEQQPRQKHFDTSTAFEEGHFRRGRPESSRLGRFDFPNQFRLKRGVQRIAGETSLERTSKSPHPVKRKARSRILA